MQPAACLVPPGSTGLFKWDNNKDITSRLHSAYFFFKQHNYRTSLNPSRTNIYPYNNTNVQCTSVHDGGTKQTHRCKQRCRMRLAAQSDGNGGKSNLFMQYTCHTEPMHSKLLQHYFQAALNAFLAENRLLTYETRISIVSTTDINTWSKSSFRMSNVLDGATLV